MLLSFLFAFALAWSYTAVGDQRGYSWGFLRFGLLLAVALTATRLGTMSMSILRRKRKDAEPQDDAGDGDVEGEEDRRPTYGEIFGTPDAGYDDGGDHDDGDEDDVVEAGLDEADDGAEEMSAMEADVDAVAEEVEIIDVDVEMTVDDDAVAEEFVEASADDEMSGHDDADMDFETDADLDAGIDREEVEADLEAQESLRQMREAFKARAREAEMRVKQREAEELDQAPSSQ
jgi:hypothetical protein